MKEENDDEKIVNKPFIFAMIGFVLFLIGLVFILTRPSNSWTMDLSNNGQIGDTIGGIVGPVINLVSIIFLYISFKSQISANRIQAKQIRQEREINQKNNNFNSLMEIFKGLKDDYNNLIIKSGPNEIYGKIAINAYITAFKKATSPEQIKTMKNQHIVKDFLFIVKQYNIILFRIENSLLNNEDKELLSTLLVNYYSTKLSNQIDSLIKLCDENSVMPLFKSHLVKARDKTSKISPKED